VSDWRDQYHRIKGPCLSHPGETRVMVDGLIFVFDGDKMAPVLDRPDDWVPPRPQDAEGMTHLMLESAAGDAVMGGGFVFVVSAQPGTACGTTAIHAPGLFWEDATHVVDCPVCRVIADRRGSR
jgi:hypothetical protein